MMGQLLNRFQPESASLLRAISRNTSDQMLERIASSDYGQDIDRHLVDLRQIRDNGVFPKEMYWYPAEVLELFRHSEPGCGDPKRGEDDEFIHWARAFTCAALLRATREPWNYGDALSRNFSTLRPIYSLRALAVDLSPQAKFFVWLLIDLGPA